MKRNIYGALAILGMALIVSVPFVQAQSHVKADVPFAFSLQDKSMPAGNYEVIALSGRVLEVWNLDTRHGQLLMKQIAAEPSKGQGSKLVFHKYGDQYFLSEIWDARSESGTAIAESKREKEVKMAGNAAPNAPETVVVAMK